MWVNYLAKLEKLTWKQGDGDVMEDWSASCFLPLLLFFFRFTSVFGFLCLVSSCLSPVFARSPGFSSCSRFSPQFFFLNQNDVVLEKKNKKTKVNGFTTGSWSGLAGSTHRVTPGFSFSRFFFNPARFQPRVGQVPGRPAGPGFKTMTGARVSNITCKSS